MRLRIISESVHLDQIESYHDVHSGWPEYLGREGDDLVYTTYLCTSEDALTFVRLELIINERTGIAWIEWLGKGPNRHNSEKYGPPGIRMVRDIFSAIKERHPVVKIFKAEQRISGMRCGPMASSPKPFRIKMNRRGMCRRNQDQAE